MTCQTTGAESKRRKGSAKARERESHRKLADVHVDVGLLGELPLSPHDGQTSLHGTAAASSHESSGVCEGKGLSASYMEWMAKEREAPETDDGEEPEEE